MEFKNFILEENGKIAKLIINRPETLNSLSSDVLTELEAVINLLSIDDRCRVLVITGAGKAFVAGADIAEMKNMNYSEAYDFAKLGHRVFSLIENAPFVSIAAINGFALGGGQELALSCDIRIASERAKFGQPEVGLGIIPGFGATQRLSRVCGVSVAKDLIYTGRIIKADEALSLGLVSRVVSADTIVDESMKVAHDINSKSYNAVITAKKAITLGIELHKTEALGLEENLFAECFNHNDQREGMSAFSEKRTPDFK